MIAADFLARHGLVMPPPKLAKVQECPDDCFTYSEGHGAPYEHNHGPLYRVTIRRTEADWCGVRRAIKFDYWVHAKVKSVWDSIEDYPAPPDAAEVLGWLATQQDDRPPRRGLALRIARFFTAAELRGLGESG